MTMLNWSSSNVNASSASSMTSDGKFNLRANRPENLNSGVDGSKGYNHQHVGHYRISELTAKLPEDFQGGQVPGLAALCPEGFMPMNSSVLSDVANGKALSILTNFGATVSAPKKMAGAELTSQLVCLKQWLPAYYSGGQYWGSYEGDVVKTRAKGHHFFTGPGNDKVSATGNSSQVYGGLGDDLLTVSGIDSVAVGGPGNDVVRALGKRRVKIDGGIGADTLIGNKGLTIIVALDGAADDVVQCVGRRNVAVIDVGDKVMGKCASVITPNAQ
jgi:Ca2+-binding RTX toxin-like protein